VVESTCTQAGLITYKCAYCDHQEKVEYPKKEHQYQQTILRQTTCEHSGKAENRCVHCGHTYTVTIPREPHKWVSGHNDVLYCNSCFIQQSASSNTSSTNNIADSKPTTSKFSNAQNDIMESIKTSLK
jgi:methionyl-tRNA synthetase